MNAKDIAKAHIKKKLIACSLEQVDCLSQAVLVAIDALNSLANDGGSGGTAWVTSIAREALAKIEGNNWR